MSRTSSRTTFRSSSSFNLGVNLLQFSNGIGVPLEGGLAQPLDPRHALLRPGPPAQSILKVLTALDAVDGANHVGFALGLFGIHETLQEARLAGPLSMRRWKNLQALLLLLGVNTAVLFFSGPRIRDQMGLASDNLDAVGGDEVKVSPVPEAGQARVLLRRRFGLGEEQFGPNHVGPGAAEDVVLVRDERVGAVKTQDLDPVLGDGFWRLVNGRPVGLV